MSLKSGETSSEYSVSLTEAGEDRLEQAGADAGNVDLGPDHLRVVKTTESRETDRTPFLGGSTPTPVIGLTAIALATGALGGYIVSTLNYASTGDTAITTLMTAGNMGGAVVVLAMASFFLGVLVHQQTGGERA